MDIWTLILTSAGSLLVGLVVGYALHLVTTRQAKQQRRALGDLETANMCTDIFNARVEYIIAYHTRTSGERNQRQAEFTRFTTGTCTHGRRS